ncbi:FAD-dependent monooxygenase [Natronosporangium hydrolyticum]|uniref:FAD-dependent monooxygenase n=1 Tax=Natronosporangium hydrolyticum TaxID=2811111 RepID=A0A895YIR2_9ACTN|nr:FAD-dependent monooxygenase [Natronosporangium hydrolyticum]QSB15922.1 FAD-dependent monooxygenase [Natronosporangium hydrolyticum]
MDVQVVVVGAGPVGLLLAGELRLGGATVAVLERLVEPTVESRASTLHARTAEVLASRGLWERLGPAPHIPRGHFAGIPMDLTLPSRFAGQWKVPQTLTEEVLGDWALGLGAELYRGWTVRAVHDDGAGVTVEADTPDGVARLRTAYLVGCDGHESTVRRLIGADFPGWPATRELLRADVRGVAIPNRRFERHDRGLAVAARISEGTTRVMVYEHGRDVAERRPAPPEFTEVVAAWRRVTGEEIGGGEPVWVNAFDDAHRQLSQYRHGRVLFAGDAAHVQLPIGGQALNLGLQDAVNLGWKLAARVRRGAPAGLLDTYHAERHPVGRRTLTNIRAQATLLLGDRSVEPVRSLFAELVTIDATRRRLAGMVSGLDIRYRPSADEHYTVGDYLAELAQPDGRGLLLAVPGSPAATAAAPWREQVTVAPPPTAPVDAAAILVRPDGHVAWAGTSAEAAHTALYRWFGPPSHSRAHSRPVKEIS